MVPAPKPDPANYRLSVRDFGPIVEADVDFRPLTVFVGPSNTGKSYLATLAYALHQVLMDDSYSPRLFRRRHDYHLHENVDVEEIQLWAKDIDTSVKEFTPIGKIEDSIMNGVEDYFQDIGTHFMFELLRYYGVADIKRLHRNTQGSSAQIRFINSLRPLEKDNIAYCIDLSKRESTVEISHLPTITLDSEAKIILDTFPIIRGKEARQAIAREVKRHVLDKAIDSTISDTVGALNRPAYYLPAERTGIMRAHRTVESALIQQAQYAGIRRSANVILLSGVLGDFLQHLIDLRPTSHIIQDQNRNFRYLRNDNHDATAKQLESQILKGHISIIRSETGSPDFFYRPTGWTTDLPLMNTSSMVSELAPVVLFLRHVVKDNAVLIIDEPESHLHPAMQAEFTRVLAGAVKAGLRVILTTHSEWVVETVGNLVELWGVPEGRRESLPGGAYALPPEDVGVWLFQEKEGESGSVVTEVERDLDTGVYGVEYDDVAMALHNEWASAANANE